MHYDSALNCAWLLLGAFALASTFGVARRRPNGAPVATWLQLVGVASVVLTLFPYISATDDILRIANANTKTKQTESGQRAPGSNLVRLYETADAPLMSQVCTLTVVFVFLCLVTFPVKTALRRSVPLQSGRSPPLSLASA